MLQISNFVLAVLLFARLQTHESGTRSLLIFPLQEKHVHSSSVVALPDGQLLACWFEGSGERTANDVCIRGARLRPGADRWGPVFDLADTPGFPDCNPVLFVDRRQRLHLFWITVLAGRWEMSLVRHRIAERFLGPGSPIWSWQDLVLLKPDDRFAEAVQEGFARLNTPEQAWAEYAPRYETMIMEAARDPRKREIGWMTRTPPMQLEDGRLLLPLYSDGFNFSLIALSEDGGKTWRPSQPIVGRGNVQPALVRKRDGTIVAFMRDNGDPPGRIMVSESTDRGESWTPPRDIDLPNPGSSIAVARLQDGRWILVYNDTEQGRHRLAVALSDDEGLSWNRRRYLENDPSARSRFAYPSIVQSEDGTIHVTYSYHVPEGKSIKHAAFRAQWIEAAFEEREER